MDDIKRTAPRKMYLTDLVTSPVLPSVQDYLINKEIPFDISNLKAPRNRVPVGRDDPKRPGSQPSGPSGQPGVGRFFPDRLPGDFKGPANRRFPPDVLNAPGGIISHHEFLTLDDLIQNIISDSSANKDVAISVTGGGARGPYEAGVIEAIFKRFRENKPPLPLPRIVTGTSAGSICATCAFVDLLYPKAAPTGQGGDIFHTRQAKVWRDTVSAGNDGAKLLFKDRAWVVEYATGKKALPGISQFFDAVHNLDAAWKDLNQDITGLATAGKNLLDAFTTMDATALTAKIKVVSATIGSDQASIKQRYDALVATLKDFDLNPFDGDTPVGDAEAIINAAWELLSALGSFLADLASGAYQIGTGAVDSLFSYLDNLGKKFGDFAVQLGKIAGDSARIIGNAAIVGVLIAALVAIITAVIAHAGEIIVGVLVYFGGRQLLEGTGLIQESKPFDHILPNDGIMRVLSDFINQAALDYSPQRLSGGKKGQLLLPRARWLELESDKNRPEIFLTGTDLNASRHMVFAYAEKKKIAGIAADNVWIYDMAAQLDVKEHRIEVTGIAPDQMPVDEQTKKERDLTEEEQARLREILDNGYLQQNAHFLSTSSKYFRPENSAEEELVKATMTSSSIPAVFEPQKWKIMRRSPDDLNTPQTLIKHSFVDGGVIDNSPLDLAMYSEAKHVISIELSPLLSYNNAPDDEKNYNIVSILAATLGAFMDGTLQRSLSYLGRANETRKDGEKVNIYRIAPLMPESVKLGSSGETKISPGTISFDGVYDENHNLVMSLYDWFMQGYIDAMGYSEALFDTAPGVAINPTELMKEDKVIDDYFRFGPGKGCARKVMFCGNKFWYMVERPIPEVADFKRDKIDIPSSEQMAAKPIWQGV